MIRGPNAFELKVPADMTIHDTVIVGTLKMYITNRAQEKPPSPPVRAVTDKASTIQHSYVVEVITFHKRAPGVKGGYKDQIK